MSRVRRGAVRQGRKADIPVAHARAVGWEVKTAAALWFSRAIIFVFFL